MRSRIYEGVVVHRRMAIREHRFQYHVAYPLLDLDELEDVAALHPLWSADMPNVIAFHRKDFFDGRDDSLSDGIRNLVEARLGIRPTGRIMLLAQLRSLGWLFNPLAVYYCWNGQDTAIEAVVLEVTNTPWHERHWYVLPGTGWHTIRKDFHVSPFLRMEHTYRVHISEPASHLVLRLVNYEDGKRVFSAAIALREHELTRSTMSHHVWRYAGQPVGVSFGIYIQALRLFLKRIPFVPHPEQSRSLS